MATGFRINGTDIDTLAEVKGSQSEAASFGGVDRLPDAEFELLAPFGYKEEWKDKIIRTLPVWLPLIVGEHLVAVRDFDDLSLNEKAIKLYEGAKSSFVDPEDV